MSDLSSGLIHGADGKSRCWWLGGDDALYQAYHDTEWGRPLTDDQRLFEKVCLEGFQCGLSWLTILRKRENFRAAFDDFDFNKVALYTESDVERLLNNEGIVRHRGKIVSTINNAARAIELCKEFGSLAAYFWSWEPRATDRPKVLTKEILVQAPLTDQSKALSKDLKKRGWSFVGPTTIYAFMQSSSIVNDHVEGCHCRKEIEKLRKGFKRP
jgi:DNA-3-methyladenine glycosylase I